MNPLAIATIAFICTFGCALLGLLLHAKLPQHHLDADSRDVVKLVMALIATMSALVLSLLIASAHASYETQREELESIAANVIDLDHTLAYYGPETKEARRLLRQSVAAAHDRVWPSDAIRHANLEPQVMAPTSRQYYEALQQLSPKSEAQRSAWARALRLSSDIAHTRLLMFEQLGVPISWLFLTMLVFWTSALFIGFGLLAPTHLTVTVALFVGALSVSTAMFMILELGEPYSGMIRLSDAPLRGALMQMEAAANH